MNRKRIYAAVSIKLKQLIKTVSCERTACCLENAIAP